MPAPAVVPTSVGIAGLGSVGRAVAARILSDLPAYTLTAVAARHRDRARDYLDGIGSDAEVVPLAEVAAHADLVVECAPAALFRELAEPAIAAGRQLVVLSAGAVLENWHLVERSCTTGATIRVPSGALLALDAVQAAAQGTISSVHMTTRKPVAGLRGAPHVEQHQVDLSNVVEPMCLFRGTAREAVAGFPANLNVAVALSLAGIGPDRTMLDVWVDPDVDRNTHTIDVESDAARLHFFVANMPSDNPKTGKLTALSVVALLRKLASPLQIGT